MKKEGSWRNRLTLNFIIGLDPKKKSSLWRLHWFQLIFKCWRKISNQNYFKASQKNLPTTKALILFTVKIVNFLLQRQSIQPVESFCGETKLSSEEIEVMVFKLFLSTLIGKSVAEGIFHFSTFSSRFAVDSSRGPLCVYMLVVRRILVFFRLVKQSKRRTKEATENFLFFRQSFHPRAHIHLSPHWHQAIKHLCRTFFFCCCSLWVSSRGSFFPLASSQLCGVIDFNIIDFLCHYQPLAPLFLVLCTQKCFCIGMEKKAEERRGKATAQKT